MPTIIMQLSEGFIIFSVSDNIQPVKTGKRWFLPLAFNVTELRSNFLYPFFHFASDPTLVPNLAGTFSTGSVSMCYQIPAEVSLTITSSEKWIAFAKRWRGSSCFSLLI